MNRNNSASYYQDSRDLPAHYVFHQPMPYGSFQHPPGPFFHQDSTGLIHPYLQQDMSYGSNVLVPAYQNENSQFSSANADDVYNSNLDPNFVTGSSFYSNDGSCANSSYFSHTSNQYQEWSSNENQVDKPEDTFYSNSTGAVNNNETSIGKSRRFSAQRSYKDGRSVSSSDNRKYSHKDSVDENKQRNFIDPKQPIRFSHQKYDKQKRHDKFKKFNETKKLEENIELQNKDECITGKVNKNADSQINILEDQLSRGVYECMVCCDRVKQHHAVWNCTKCFHVFHMRCIRKWARSNAARVDQLGWRCPACQTTTKKFPNAYYCFCGKLKDPEWNHNDMAHSCGEVCSKKRDSNLNCDHPCNILCHPGPCPPCPAMVNKFCLCKKTKQRMRCGLTKDLKCDSKCEKLLNCGIHKCKVVCHNGECENCAVEIEQTCFCGNVKRTILCGSIEHKESIQLPQNAAFTCKNICNKLLECGNHKCENVCHEGKCQQCSLLPSVVKFCPCQQTLLSEVKNDQGNVVDRKSCLDPIPVCNKVCNKPLKCGGSDEIHFCKSLCHDGPCSPCGDNETTVLCRCGKSDKTMTCEEYVKSLECGKEFICDRRCNKKRKCGRHKCGQLCCTDSDHTCNQVCGRKLTCGVHRCEETCHRGNCHSCYNVSFDDLTCYCGAEVILPPIQCGTKPPECANICTRSHSCYHPIQHTCHNEECCPPCVMLVKKTCNCGRVVRSSIPCYQENVSCGYPCGKTLACGHKCLKTCHMGPCLAVDESCKQPCSIMRIECIHPCANPCHHGESCPTTKCKATVTLKCVCSNRQAQVECCESVKFQKELSKEILSSQQFKGSIDIANFCQGNSSPTRYLPCNDECKVLERNKKLAEALNIDPSKTDKENESKLYSTFLKEMVQRDIKFVENVEQELTNLVDSVKWLGQSKKHSFPPMKREKRQVIHELAEVFKCDSQSYDEEPKRSVTVKSTKQSKVPSILLSAITQREKQDHTFEKPKPAVGSSGNNKRLLKSMKLVSLSSNDDKESKVFAMKPKSSFSLPKPESAHAASNLTNLRPKYEPKKDSFKSYSYNSGEKITSTSSNQKPSRPVQSKPKSEPDIDYFDVVD